MTDISKRAVENHLNINVNHEAGLIPMATQIMLCALSARNAELEAELAALRAGRVKPLEWRYPEHHKDAEYAGTIIDEYSVWEIDGVGYWRGPDDYVGKQAEGDINAAKAAAQADYERRILSALTTPDDTRAADDPDNLAVDRFAAAMKEKLRHAREVKGKGGWDGSDCDDNFLATELVHHLAKGNTGTFEDVANFCMMLHQRGASPHDVAAAYHRAQAYDANPAPADAIRGEGE